MIHVWSQDTLPRCFTVISLGSDARVSANCLRCQDKSPTRGTVDDLVIVGRGDIKDKPVWLGLICVGLETEKGPSDPRVLANEGESYRSDVSLCNCHAIWKPNSSRLALQQGSLKYCQLPCSFTNNDNKLECKERCVCSIVKWVIIGFHLKHTSWVSQFC